MTRYCIVPVMLAFCACSSSSGGTNETGNDSGPTGDATSQPPGEDTGSPVVESGAADTGSALDTGSPSDAGAGDGATGDGGTGDGGDGAIAADGSCPAAWTVAPTVDPSIAVPDGGGAVLLHASGAGTQNYICDAVTVDGGATTYAWTLVTPAATLSDCNGEPIGHHFASEAGSTAPEWQTTDGTYVVGRRIGAFTPDGGAGSIAWFLLQGTEHGGTGTLSNAQYIQRLFTDGGVAPAASCTEAAVGNTLDVPYGADYYFFGP
jgi:hypothetical protein